MTKEELKADYIKKISEKIKDYEDSIVVLRKMLDDPTEFERYAILWQANKLR